MNALLDRLQSLEEKHSKLSDLFEAKEAFVEELDELTRKHELQLEELEEVHNSRVEILEKKQLEEVEEFMYKHRRPTETNDTPKRSSKLPVPKRSTI